MVGGRRPELRRELGPARGFQLVGVKLERQTGFPRRLENRATLGNGEDARLAEDIGEPRETFSHHEREHFVDEQVHVSVTGRPVLERDLMGSEPRWDQPYR